MSFSVDPDAAKVLFSRSGLYKPAIGDIFIKGKSIVSANIVDKQNIMKEFGVLYQSGALFGSYVEENIRIVLEEHTDLSKDEMKAEQTKN